MKQFFKFMFASMAGFVLAMILFFIISLIILSAAVSSMSSETKIVIKKNSVLELRLDKAIEERTSNNPFDDFNFGELSSNKNLGLNDILKNIKKAEKDENIKGILLNLTSVSAGGATIEEIRNALVDFKSSKKFIYAYGEELSQGAYYLASVADKIYLHPEGGIDFKGLRAELMFFKGTLEKLEVEPQVIRHGKFKSAVEPFINDKMSPENKEQIRTLIQSFWNNYLVNVSEQRKKSIEKLQIAADEFSARDAEGAIAAGLADSLAYFDQVQEVISTISGTGPDEKVKFITLNKYDKVYVKGMTELSTDKIALIYASGDIVSGQGSDDQIGSDKMAETIRKARLDDKIKAIVLRVNSPGGSAMASDVIWREVLLAKKKKPVVVSMGDYAASGGYYISCAADSIVAQPNTLTGSIGVFGLLINAQKLFNNKLGITFDTVKTGRYADIGTISRRLSNDERDLIQMQVEKIYSTFIKHVAEGRNMTTEYVDSIGQGRIWSGNDALRLGLVDAIGGIDEAIAIASRMAKLEKYRVIQLPEQKELFEKILEDLNAEANVYFTKRELGDQYKYYEKLKGMIQNNGIQARIPFEMEIY
ncbi:MAG: signal peptide peptidase SppA [Bacteroidetes bacterium]|nr:MAG: signal peptide peptidase SppA [Bacteroidota bacterium]